MTAIDATPRRTDGDPAERGDVALELLTDDGAEWTVVPPDADGHERMTRWLTVDRDDLRDLSEWR